MTDSQTITKLIKDLQSAEVGTRELDLRIAKAFAHEHGRREDIHLESRSYSVYNAENFYSTSIDAAMTTIPDGWELFEIKLENGSYGLRLRAFRSPRPSDILYHKFIPLSICIASLSAMLMEVEA